MDTTGVFAVGSSSDEWSEQEVDFIATAVFDTEAEAVADLTKSLRDYLFEGTEGMDEDDRADTASRLFDAVQGSYSIRVETVGKSKVAPSWSDIGEAAETSTELGSAISNFYHPPAVGGRR